MIIDILNILFVIFLFCLILLFYGIISVVIYYIFKYLRDKFKWNNKFLQNKYLILYLSIFSIGLSVYETYRAFYPADSFYFKEFEHVTNQKIPDSAEIKFKDSCYPDIHGEYFSKSVVELSKNEFNKLFTELKNNKDLVESKTTDYLGVFDNKEKSKEGIFRITFYKDRRTIEVYVDVF